MATYHIRPASNVSHWPISEAATPLIEVGLVQHSGLDLLTVSSSHFDPKATFAAKNELASGDKILHTGFASYILRGAGGFDGRKGLGPPFESERITSHLNC
jgi:hypothetical protein